MQLASSSFNSFNTQGYLHCSCLPGMCRLVEVCLHDKARAWCTRTRDDEINRFYCTLIEISGKWQHTTSLNPTSWFTRWRRWRAVRSSNQMRAFVALTNSTRVGLLSQRKHREITWQVDSRDSPKIHKRLRIFTSLIYIVIRTLGFDVAKQNFFWGEMWYVNYETVMQIYRNILSILRIQVFYRGKTKKFSGEK